MLIKTIAILLLTGLAGCAQLQPIGGNGRFLQFNTNGQIYLQFDTVSLDACRREGNSTERKAGIELICSTVTQASSLPASFTVTSVVTGEIIIVRSRNPKACQIFHNEFDKLNSEGAHEADACK